MTVGVESGAGATVGTPRPGPRLRVVVVIPCLDDAGFLAVAIENVHQTRQRPGEWPGRKIDLA